MTAATFFSSGEVWLSCPSLAQTHFPAVGDNAGGWPGEVSPRNRGRDVKEQLPTCPGCQGCSWKTLRGVMQRSGHQGMDGLAPLLVLPCPPFSLCSCPGSEQVEVAKTSEFLVHLEFSAPSSDSRSQPSPWQLLCQDHPGCPGAVAPAHHIPHDPQPSVGTPGRSHPSKLRCWGIKCFNLIRTGIF